MRHNNDFMCPTQAAREAKKAELQAAREAKKADTERIKAEKKLEPPAAKKVP